MFKHAHFKTIKDLMDWEKDKLVDTGECLFIEPFAKESEFNISHERELADTRKGGFICSLWRK